VARQIYSTLILEETFKLSLEYPDSYAYKKTGVNKWVALKYIQRRRYETGIMRRRRPRLKKFKHSTADKIACVKTAIKLFDGGYYKTMVGAFAAAAKKYGMNPGYIMAAWKEKRIYPGTLEAQQLATKAALSGASNQTASPQSQSLAEQCKALNELRPARRIKRRRVYDGPISPNRT